MSSLLYSFSVKDEKKMKYVPKIMFKQKVPSNFYESYHQKAIKTKKISAANFIYICKKHIFFILNQQDCLLNNINFDNNVLFLIS